MTTSDINKFGSSELKVLVEDLRRQRESLEKKEKTLKEREEELISRLEKASGMTRDEAGKIILEEVQKTLSSEVAKKVRNAEERIREEAGEKAKEILADAMKHGATTYVAEYTVSTVTVPNEDVKGRIIGAGGRNIRTFERESGVEIEIDETNEIRLSSFDSVRREIARRALEALIKDQRIQPSRIEEVIRQIKNEMEDVLLEEGKEIAHECGVFNLPVDLMKLIGRYRFRTSYGQNLGLHTIEETKIGIAIANELGANIDVVRLGCLLHDIGKVVTDEEGTHVEAGVNTIKRFGLPKEVVAAVAEHHEDKPFSSVESVIVWTADAISGSRPGARYEPHEEYVKRMGKIEEIAASFPGVDSTMAFQAGRDVRVIVNPQEVDDDKVTVLAHDIAARLEKEAEYAGQIKVTVIREVRAVGTTAAK
ncbi:MAG: Ribonuclease Y [Candidatus Woesebacteria bacterium GW2011_GWC2_47_16]|uniref:Ribonuclease Y n=9 Tax=Candidatus Woeseibacteriota TaxID=1752722 RepID=A0A0G1VL67_9BACT|nr:MAG: Ribonuclease Y [Candidatus Woesebacteria bacterium GW2011_GWE1_45_18]KKU64858.1 MAG: Ribonuclease Y [Candidatus Woesebacteria bacterium GW2011_GWC2_47_16]KKU70795.1 MAG: Ribonuclease Y [Candidatus Woesebacteria bacterium GW2011_GWD1_47_21]OGM79484.1 MAG: ribonuclease Y [Candidatus Woesebacteria bacterium RIFOXYA1_FULL_48_16]OGM84258.1 MAG: ribonuclease Y [Candidatus Woesebacteria bacterium RIFOXYB1_FULL_47_31]OGM86286.1 MAG: ribonuclease Y [Candidatus Woesebacteria bacterium RIFOXYC1_F